MPGMWAILPESRQREIVLTAEFRPAQAALRVSCGDLRDLRTAATMATNCRNGKFTHAFSESSFKTYEKNGLARRDTLKQLYSDHIVVEETIVFARASQLLDSHAIAAIGTEFRFRRK
jgi:hypothetical protein